MSIRTRDIRLLVYCCAFMTLACGCEPAPERDDDDGLFILLDPEKSGVDFVNRIEPDETINILTYEYLYNGGGVGVGDFNNDGFQDVFFAGSQVPGKLFMNKGKNTNGEGFSFTDVTADAGITRDHNWVFGVSVADINQDGWQDIYISVGGPGNMNSFPNRLFIHQGLDQSGQPFFKEMASAYGLADRGQSIQALFFDFDRDGDLDMYQVTGGGFERSPNNPSPIVKDGTAVNTDRLYRNDYDTASRHPVFTNVSGKAGIVEEGYGLGVSLCDINEDGWPDVYVTNDYLTNDHLYINNQDGTFSDRIADYFKHTSHFAMGNDMGDVNNDGLMDVIAVDMLPDDHYRRKLMFGATQYNKFYYAVNHGYTYQYMRNTLQLNNGNGSFSEIGQLSGIYKTDWSWAVLFADLDNDQYQDVFITNGFGKDVTDLDFVKFRSNINSEVRNEQQRRKILLDSLAQRPGIRVANYAYQNSGNLLFKNVSKEWGFDTPAYSNGAAYADFDNDGDLDLVVSNLDEPAFVYRNMQRERSPSINYLRLRLMASGANASAIGGKVTLRYDGKIQSKFQSVVRGFQSTVEDHLHFGLGTVQSIDTVEVQWPDGRMTLLTNVSANQVLTISDAAAGRVSTGSAAPPPLFQSLNPAVIPYKHSENHFIDFNHEPLLPHKLSQEGPGMAVGDLNGDGLDDLYVGGALLQPGKILIQDRRGKFQGRTLDKPDLEKEDMGCLLFDADNDSDLDLYIVSGGNEYNADHRHYQDRLYFNDGKGKFVQREGSLPPIGASGSTVVGSDFDHDGDVDLFVGGRVLPTSYPKSPRSYLLINDGRGVFEDATERLSAELQHPGMVTGALWTDVDNDSWQDLMIVGEYMPITVFKNESGEKFTRLSAAGLQGSEGWWKSLTAGDFDNDGDMDYIAGNFGLNSHYRASKDQPLNVAYKDFDGNGAIEAITSYYEDGINYPTTSLDVLVSQLPVLKRRILFHRTYANTTTDALLRIAGAEGAGLLYCRMLESAYVENIGGGEFRIKPLPLIMQTAPVYGVRTDDVNGDGLLDFMAVGNSYAPEVVSGRCDAFIGQVMLGDGLSGFQPMPVTSSGFFCDGDSKSLVELLSRNERLIIVGQNNDSLKIFKQTRSVAPQWVKLKLDEVTAVVVLRDGRSRRVEAGYGQTYLSQSTRAIAMPPDAQRIDIYDMKGKQTRSVLAKAHPASSSAMVE